VTEARNADDEEFGEDRLIAAIVANRACSAPALEARISECLASFASGSLQDDATLIVVAVD
jgi:serine phosphatase RsbU (regulator of sigma subunit)